MTIASGVQGSMELTIPLGKLSSLYLEEFPDFSDTAGEAETRETGDMKRMLQGDADKITEKGLIQDHELVI